ncbi:gliding motility-associated C-terminal domain-containing protein [Bacteroidales bacterium AH-315-N07]|nr:gliding motility-associated C-terminal domain-containing protein [Bacteroidales bacterium AH-315-N07]
MKFWSFIFITSILVVFPTKSHCTHIVGGELTYQCLGGDNYEIRLSVYRDCYYGSPFAPFDPFAAIGIFDSNDYLLQTLLIQLPGQDTLNDSLLYTCIIPPNNVCVEKTTYIDTINLPIIKGGYQLAYQRCCRNWTIKNIPTPGNQGATYYTHISDSAMASCNSSPSFKQWPPLYVCVNTAIDFDHSASDIEGDSIVYDLCNPYDGASTTDPMPQPPFNPPYDTITWLPPYYSDDPLGGNSLNINPQTGKLTGMPTDTGQFVVGICATEYRNGEIISKIHRDFQYNIMACGKYPIAAASGVDALCSDSTMQFFDASIGADYYYWDFGVNGINSDTSYDKDPIYTFPDTGKYSVTYIITSGIDTTCKDTLYKDINIYMAPIKADYSYQKDSCINFEFVSFTDQTTTSDTSFTIASWYWDFMDGDTSSLQNPVHSFKNPGWHLIDLITTADNGCVDTITKNLYVIIDVPIDTLPLNTTCYGIPVQLTAKNGDNYIWSPSTGLNDSTIKSPLVNSDTSITYTVKIYNLLSNNDTCRSYNIIPLNISYDTVDVSVGNDTIVCDDAISLAAYPTGTVLAYQWLRTFDFTGPPQIVGTDSMITSTLIKGINIFFAGASNQYCSAIDTIIVDYEGVIAFLDDPENLCLSDSIQLNVINLFKADTLSYFWTPPTGLDNTTISNPYAFPTNTTTYNVWISVLKDSVAVCSINKETTVNVSVYKPEVWAGNDTSICDDILLKATTNGGVQSFIWSTSSNFTDTLNSDISDNTVLISPTRNQSTYYIKVSIPYCEAFDSINIISNEIDIETETDRNICIKDTINISLNITRINPQDTVTYTWSPSTGILSGENTADPIIDPDSTTTYYITVTNEFGCWDVETIVVNVSTAIANILAETDEDTITRGESTILHALYATGFNILWSPAKGLSSVLDSDPVASPDSTTLYYLTITDNIGCINIDTVSITVIEPIVCGEKELFIPNAFTPDGDNTNDVLYVRGAEELETMFLMIYDRWGEKVFQTDNRTIGWDGTYKGMEADPGVFVYYLQLKCPGEKLRVKKGNITLIR